MTADAPADTRLEPRITTRINISQDLPQSAMSPIEQGLRAGFTGIRFSAVVSLSHQHVIHVHVKVHIQLLVSFLPLRGLLPSTASISAMRGGVNCVSTLMEPMFSSSCSVLETPSRTELTPSLRRHQAIAS